MYFLLINLLGICAKVYICSLQVTPTLSPAEIQADNVPTSVTVLQRNRLLTTAGVEASPVFALPGHFLNCAGLRCQIPCQIDKLCKLNSQIRTVPVQPTKLQCHFAVSPLSFRI